MNKYALIVNDKIENVVESEAVPTTEGTWVLLSGSFGPGDNYVAGVFSKNQILDKKHITKLAFISRFTDQEAVMIDLASIGPTVNAATVRRYLQKVNLADYIDLNREDTVAGVNALESLGLIGPGRASQILNDSIKPQEVYHESDIRS